MRNVMHLNFDWKYQREFNEAYIDCGFDDSDFSDVMIPHANIVLPYNNFSDALFQFTSCYRKRFALADECMGKRAILHFDGVMTYCRVYLNGAYIGEHKGGYTHFQWDVTEFIRNFSENLVVVMVDSTEREDIPPFGHVIDYLTYGGIYREVRIEFVNDVSIDNLYIKTRDVGTGNMNLEIDLYLQNQTGKEQEVTFAFELLHHDESVLRFEESEVVLKPGMQKLSIGKTMPQGMMLWGIQEPNLYHLVTKILLEGEVVDDCQERFGFREALFKNDGFHLNGKNIKLRGLNRHQSFPYVGYAMPKSAQYKDADILKLDLGVNIVRLSHYPQSRHFLDRCDELGLLVFEEMPGWQHIGNEAWQADAVQNVREMIQKDWNHPSIILWGVRINESQDNDGFYLKTNEVAKELDSVRQTGGVRDFEGSRLLEDVYTYNDFVHSGVNEALQQARHVVKKEVPYLVTEHNGHMFPTKKFDNESKRVEQALRHLRVLDKMYQSSDISGSIGWCMCDYNTHKDFGSGDRICYHGVLDMFRIPKEAAGAYASQQDERPVMEVATAMVPGERDAGVLKEACIFTNCDCVKLSKNGAYVGTHWPDRRTYPGVPHPPVVITDFIGDLIEKNEGFSRKDAKVVKEVLQGVVQYGDKSLPLQYKVKMALLMIKYKMTYKKVVALYTTYVANWGSKSLTYEFTGYVHDKPVVTTKKGPADSKGLLAVADKDRLVEEETYDVCRIVLKHIDDLGNVMTFSNEVVSLEVEGAGELIGPGQLSLIGGSIAFWIKSIGKSGNLCVRVRTQRLGDRALSFAVEKR